MSQPTSRRRRGRPRRNQGSYDGPTWLVGVLLEVKAPTLAEALRRVGAIGHELVEGTGVDASDLWVRSFVIDNQPTGVTNDQRTISAAGV